jgi:hypothetical protein
MFVFCCHRKSIINVQNSCLVTLQFWYDKCSFKRRLHKSRSCEHSSCKSRLNTTVTQIVYSNIVQTKCLLTDVSSFLGIEEAVSCWRRVIQLGSVCRVDVELGVVLVADDRHVGQVFVLDPVEKGVGRVLVGIKLEGLQKKFQ